MANRVLLGYRANGGYGLYVSQAGQNVETCADGYLMFDSRANGLSVLQQGTFVVPASAPSATLSFPTQVSTPIIECYRKVNVPWYAGEVTANTLGGWEMAVTTNSVTFHRGTYDGTVSVTFYYIIYGVSN